MLGTDPVFVFDPEKASNRPVTGAQDNLRLLWPTLPRVVQRLFTRAFTEGLADPEHGRVTEGEWLDVLLRLRGLVRLCPTCGTEQFVDETAPADRCAQESYRARLERPVVLHGRPRRPVVLDEGKVLLHSDLSGKLESSDERVGDTVRHPVNGGLALRNQSAEDWRLHRGADRPEVPLVAALLLRDAQQLDIGSMTFRCKVHSPLPSASPT